MSSGYSQLHFKFFEEEKYNPQDYIVGQVNTIAYNKIVNWSESWNSKFFPYFLLLYGPKLSGKTHLAQIWSKKTNAIFLKRFTQEYNQHIVIEDIDNIIGYSKECDLLHAFNLCNENKNYCLFTSKTFPLKFQLDDLSSRINSIDRVNISYPDFEMKKVILRKEFTKLYLQVDQKIIDFLSDIIPSTFEAIKFAVEKINKSAMSEGKKMSLNFIKSLFSK